MDKTSSAPTARSSRGRVQPRLLPAARPRPARRPETRRRNRQRRTPLPQKGTAHEHFRAVYPAAGRHLAPDGRTPTGRPRRISAAHGGGSPAGRLSDHFSIAPPSRRERRYDGLRRHDAAGAAVRPDAVAHADDLGVVFWCFFVFFFV